MRRVIALNKCMFGSIRIFLDSWTAGAGRSTCLEDQGLAWVSVKGIPLHIRSAELFQSLGDLCGGFIEFDTQRCSLYSVRLKIAPASSIPPLVKI
ncbi:hypothetical protein LINPERPRIM_LOCUS40737 [Linum perenne]